PGPHPSKEQKSPDTPCALWQCRLASRKPAPDPVAITDTQFPTILLRGDRGPSEIPPQPWLHRAASYTLARGRTTESRSPLVAPVQIRSREPVRGCLPLRTLALGRVAASLLIEERPSPGQSDCREHLAWRFPTAIPTSPHLPWPHMPSPQSSASPNHSTFPEPWLPLVAV